MCIAAYAIESVWRKELHEMFERGSRPKGGTNPMMSMSKEAGVQHIRNIEYTHRGAHTPATLLIMLSIYDKALRGSENMTSEPVTAVTESNFPFFESMKYKNETLQTTKAWNTVALFFSAPYLPIFPISGKPSTSPPKGSRNTT